jgi:hypothetical protein
VNEIAQKLVPPIGETRVRLALQHLQATRLVEGNFDSPRFAGFAITRKGIVQVEEEFERSDDGNGDTSYRPKPCGGFEEGELRQLPSEGIYVAPVPPIDDDAAVATSGAPIVIHNHINPVFNNSNEQKDRSDPEVNRLAKSGARAGWFSFWAATIIGLGGIVVALWIAGAFSA